MDLGELFGWQTQKGEQGFNYNLLVYILLTIASVGRGNLPYNWQVYVESLPGNKQL